MRSWYYWIMAAFCVLLMAAIGGVILICAFFSDRECERIFTALAGALWLR